MKEDVVKTVYKLHRYLIILVLLSSCTNSKSVKKDKFQNLTDTIQINSFKQQKVNFRKTGINLGSIVGMTVADSFLICSSLRSHQILHIIGINSNQYLGQIINRGKNKGECLSVASILTTSDKNKIWVYDTTLGKLMKIDVQQALKDKNYISEREFTLSNEVKGAKSPNWINDSLFVSCSYSIDDCRFFYFNNYSKVIQKTGVLPEPDIEWPQQDSKQKISLRPLAFSANLTKHPSKDMYVVAYNTTDRLELYENKKLKSIINGPDLFKPLYKFKELGDEIFKPVTTRETQFAHMQIYATDKYFYSLYSGKKNYETCGRKILVFDWNGRPVKSLELENEYCSFAIIEKGNNTILYSIDNRTGEVVYANIK